MLDIYFFLCLKFLTGNCFVCVLMLVVLDELFFIYYCNISGSARCNMRGLTFVKFSLATSTCNTKILILSIIGVVEIKFITKLPYLGFIKKKTNIFLNKQIY